MKIISSWNIQEDFTGSVEYANGNKQWFLNSKRHRTNGPAIEYFDGDKQWFLNDKLHRENGPACEYASGYKYWYLNGIGYSEKEWKKKLKK